MDWIQLVLPSEGMRDSLLRFLDVFEQQGKRCHELDREQIASDFYGWMEQQHHKTPGSSAVVCQKEQHRRQAEMMLSCL